MRSVIQRAPFEANGPGYGYNDYCATIGTDMDPQGISFNSAPRQQRVDPGDTIPQQLQPR